MRKIFFLLVATFLLIVTYFVLPLDPSIKDSLFMVVALLALLFSIFGAVLIVQVVRNRKLKKSRFYLLATGISAASFLPAILLHNLVYALMIMMGFEVVDEAFFFIIALIIVPTVFLIGAIRSIVYMYRGEV